MSAERPSLTACAAGLAIASMPVWVLDCDSVRICWANELALALWHAEDRDELFRRDFVASAPEKVLARLRHVISQVRAGEALCEEWVFYPRGQPTSALLHLRSISLADGRDGMLTQAAPLAPAASDAVVRAVTAMRHLSTPVAYVGEGGEPRMRNPAALAEFGDAVSWVSWFVDPEEARAILRAAQAGEAVRVEARVRGRNGERWHAIEAHALRDPVIGDLGILVLHRDETERVEAERTAANHLLVVEAQHREIVSLSAPILAVDANTLTVPVIGRLDAARGREISERLLHAIVAQRTRRVILDLTGVVEIDDASAARLGDMIAAIRLLGASPVLTGLRPALAQALADAALDLGPVVIRRSLADALHSQPQGARNASPW